MTDEEHERKAEMYEMHVCGIHSNSKLRKAYKDGYSEGRRIESDLIFETWCKDLSSPCGFLLEREAEIETLKKSIEKMKKQRAMGDEKITFDEWKADNSHEIEDLADYFMRHDTEDYFVHDKYLEAYEKIELLCKLAFDRE